MPGNNKLIGHRFSWVRTLIYNALPRDKSQGKQPLISGEAKRSCYAFIKNCRTCKPSLFAVSGMLGYPQAAMSNPATMNRRQRSRSLTICSIVFVGLIWARRKAFIYLTHYYLMQQWLLPQFGRNPKQGPGDLPGTCLHQAAMSCERRLPISPKITILARTIEQVS